MITSFTHRDTSSSNDDSVALIATRQWLEKAVIGLNLCPFAKAVYVRQQIRFAVSDACDAGTLIDDLADELQALADADPALLDTTLLIHPRVLNDFIEYNDFLGTADGIVESLGLSGVLQIASFHPEYQFVDSEPDDIENFTNRSPYPILHLLREDSISKAVASFPDASSIYEKNMETLRKLGQEGWAKLQIHPFTPE